MSVTSPVVSLVTLVCDLIVTDRALACCYLSGGLPPVSAAVRRENASARFELTESCLLYTSDAADE